MLNSLPTRFKLSLMSLAVFTVQQSFAEDLQNLPTISVQATAEQTELSSEQSKSYIVKKSTSAAKLNIPVKETPQTVNVVTRQQMNDFAMNSTRDALSNTPGITVSNQETERSTYTARGFEISNLLTDGVGFPSSSYNYNNTNPDTYFYDRIDVIKGADALTNAFGDQVQPSIIFVNDQHKSFKPMRVSVMVLGILNVMRQMFLVR